MRLIIALFILTFCYMTTFAQNQIKNTIQYEDLYTVYITNKLKSSKDFYVDLLGFHVVFESSWFIYLQSPGERNFSFGLMDVNHPSSPPSYGAFPGSGSFLTLQVSDAASLYQKFKDNDTSITYPLTTEDWGQIRFGLTDPNGLYIDIVQQVEPKAGYWELYPPGNE